MRLVCLLALCSAAPSALAQASWISATGRVYDARTGESVVGARVTMWICDAVDQPATCGERRWSGWGETDARGAFNAASVMPRVYAIRVEHPGYEPALLPPYDERALLAAYRANPTPTDYTPRRLPGGRWGSRREWGQPHYEIALVPAADGDR